MAMINAVYFGPDDPKYTAFIIAMVLSHLSLIDRRLITQKTSTHSFATGVFVSLRIGYDLARKSAVIFTINDPTL